MNNRIFRLVLVLVALAGIGGAAYYVFTLEQRSASLREADRAFTEDLLRVQATLADLRAAHAAYLATGQDTAVWIEKTKQLRQQGDAQLKRLADSAAGAEVEGTLSAVAESLASFGRFDARVKEVLRDEQPLTASGLIFSDAAQVLATASGSLSAARGTRATRTGTALARLRQLELYAVGAAAGVVFLVLLLLLRAPSAKREVEAVAEDGDALQSDPFLAVPAARGRPGLGLDLDLEPSARAYQEIEPVASRFGMERVTEPPTAKPVPAGPDAADRGQAAVSSVDAAAAAPEPKVDLAAAARLCTDLARVHDTSELQGLLARAAALLDATGIVVWMGGVEGDVLWPAFSHGYSPQALTKMQALPREAATPVSEAFRKGLMEVVPAGHRNSGAIVAPILTAGGCVGVMAVEIRHGAETQDSEQAMASIVAAQLATLVAGEADSVGSKGAGVSGQLKTES